MEAARNKIAATNGGIQTRKASRCTSKCQQSHNDAASNFASPAIAVFVVIVALVIHSMQRDTIQKTKRFCRIRFSDNDGIQSQRATGYIPETNDIDKNNHCRSQNDEPYDETSTPNPGSSGAAQFVASIESRATAATPGQTGIAHVLWENAAFGRRRKEPPAPPANCVAVAAVVELQHYG